MKRKIVVIDENKCSGCGLCVNACHENAIILENNKARLLSDSYCDGLGDCLPHCPMDAIKIEVKEVKEYDHKLVLKRQEELGKTTNEALKKLKNWPIQLKLVPTDSCIDSQHLIVAATCTAFSYSKFHSDFLDKRHLLIGCSKLDDENYTERLKCLLENNDIKSICIVIMDVPCCKGMLQMVKNAIVLSGKDITYSVRIISTKGELKECY